ncbi:hypothetical protein, partial [Enterococcus faecalis]|uniref:hypothetical protein n=1 Tax=Enterococcus faecalis TaxID=1351 RepID=UPI000668E59C
YILSYKNPSIRIPDFGVQVIYAFFNFGEAVPIPHYLVNGTVIFDTQSEEREQLVQQGTLLKSYQGLLITINE